MLSTRAMNVSVCRVRSASSVSVDPLEPMLRAMSSNQVLEVVGEWDTLRLCSAEEVVLDGVSVIAKRHLDGSLEAMNVAVVARALVRLVFLHQRNELLGGPALSLKVIVVGRRGTSVHLTLSVFRDEVDHTCTYHEVDGRSTSEDIGAWHDCTSSTKVFRGSGVVERGRLTVQLHVSRVDAWTEDPWVVQVALSTLDQENLKVVV
jgi:hypothetical protein